MKKSMVFLLFIVIGFIIYFRSLFNDFLWDDIPYILLNPFRQSLKYFFDFFIQPWYDYTGRVVGSIYYRPFIDIYVALIYSLFGPTSFFFHLFQVLFHITNSFLVYLIFEKHFHKLKLLPLFLSLIFLVHPINVEAVVWISAIQEILFITIGLCAFYFAIKSRNNKNINKSSLILTGVVFTSILFKETAILFILLIFIYLLLFDQKKEAFLYFYYSFISMIGYLIIRIITKSYVYKQLIFSSIMHASFLERIYTMPKVIIFYLTTFFYPRNLAISQHWVVKTITFESFILPLIIIFIFFTLCLIYIIKTKNKLFLFFFIWFMLGLGIHSQIIPLSMTVAERWFYFPMIGLLGMIGVFIQNIKYKKTLYIIGIIILLALSLRSYFRTLNWKDGLTLYKQDQKINKTSYDLENNLGSELMESGQVEKALDHYKKSLIIDPYYFGTWHNLGYCYYQKDEFDLAENYIKESLKRVKFYPSYTVYIDLLFKQNRMNDLEKILNEALLIYPDNQLLNQAKNNINDVEKLKSIIK